MTRFLKQAAEKVVSIDKAGAVDEDDVLAVLTRVRKHLEESNVGSEYRITKYYCNWPLHPELSYSPSIELLDKLTRVVAETEIEMLNDKINECLSVHVLREELIELMESAGVTTPLFSSARGWKAFLSALLRMLVEVPVIRRTEPKGMSKFVSRLLLEVPDPAKLDQGYLSDTGLASDTVFWKIHLMPQDYQLAGPLVLTELPDAFERA